MNFKPTLPKSIASLLIALFFGYLFGRPGFRFDMGDFLMISIPLLVVVYVIWSLAEKNKK
jgi:hypothetical protein